MSTVQLLALMLYSTFCCAKLFSEVLSIKNDFCLTNFQFLRGDVALSYLVESIEIIFCHCVAVKVRDFKNLGNLVCVWNQSVNNLWTKHQDLKEEWRHRWTFQRKIHLWYFTPEGITIKKNEKNVFTGFPSGSSFYFSRGIAIEKCRNIKTALCGH